MAGWRKPFLLVLLALLFQCNPGLVNVRSGSEEEYRTKGVKRSSGFPAKSSGYAQERCIEGRAT